MKRILKNRRRDARLAILMRRRKERRAQPTALIDTVDGWEAKRIEPRAVLLVSRTARRILVVPTATKPRWQVATRRDGVRGT